MKIKYYTLFDILRPVGQAKNGIFSQAWLCNKRWRERQCIGLLGVAFFHLAKKKPRNAWGDKKIRGEFFNFAKTAIQEIGGPIFRPQSDIALAKQIRRAFLTIDDARQIEFECFAIFSILERKLRQATSTLSQDAQDAKLREFSAEFYEASAAGPWWRIPA